MMIHSSLVLSFVFSLFLWSTARTEEDGTTGTKPVTEPASGKGGCVFTEETLAAAVNASRNGALTRVVVNCLSFKDSSRTLNNAIVSVNQAGTRSRYVATCSNGVLILTRSSIAYTSSKYYCSECRDSTGSLCATGKQCMPSGCSQCFGPSPAECIGCENARFENQCIAECPPRREPNKEKGNECECIDRFTGEDCTVCDLICSGEDGYYYVDPVTCLCVQECPSFIELMDYTATVPESVIGTTLPADSEVFEGIQTFEGKRRRRNFRRQEGGAAEIPPGEGAGGEGAGGEGAEGGGEEVIIVPEPGRCANVCSIATYEAGPETNNECYACGHKYCLECDPVDGACLQCRDGTLLNESAGSTGEFCPGFFLYLEDLTIELELEEEEEFEEFHSQQEQLILYLPLSCAIFVTIFVSLALFAHYHYPHHDEDEFHHNPPKEVPHFQRAFRPQSTAIYR